MASDNQASSCARAKREVCRASVVYVSPVAVLSGMKAPRAVGWKISRR